MSLTKVTYSIIYGPSVNFLDFCADPTGIQDSSAAIQSAINSNAAIVILPAGTFTISTTLEIRRSMQFIGAGSSGINWNPGLNTTNLVYTGTGVAMKVGSSPVTDEQNIHLSDFRIEGNVNADGGIDFGYGSGEWFLESSAKRICVFGFSKAGAYGFRFKSCISSYFEQLIGRYNYWSMAILGSDINTSITLNRCHNYTAGQYGCYFVGFCTGSEFSGLINEQSAEEGLYIDSPNFANSSFISYYSESNGDTGATWLAPVSIHEAQYLNFFGGLILDYKPTYKAIYLDSALRIRFYNITLQAYQVDFITCTSNTSGCRFDNWNIDYVATAIANQIAGNSYGRVSFNGGVLDDKVATTSGVATVIFNPVTAISGGIATGIYTLGAYLIGPGVADYYVKATVIWNGTNLTLTTDYEQPRPDFFLTQTGTTITITQTTGGGRDVYFAWSKLN